MERLDKGHLHTKLEVPRLTCLGRESNPWPLWWEANPLANSYLNTVLISIRNIYIWTRDMAPPIACGYMNNEHTYMNSEHTWVGWIVLESRSTLNFDIRYLQARKFTVNQDRSRQGHHYGEIWPRSSPSSTRGPETNMHRPLQWEVCTLARAIRTAY